MTSFEAPTTPSSLVPGSLTSRAPYVVTMRPRPYSSSPPPLCAPLLTMPSSSPPPLYCVQVFSSLSGLKSLLRTLITQSILTEFGGRRGSDLPRYPPYLGA